MKKLENTVQMQGDIISQLEEDRAQRADRATMLAKFEQFRFEMRELFNQQKCDIEDAVRERVRGTVLHSDLAEMLEDKTTKQESRGLSDKINSLAIELRTFAENFIVGR